MGDNLIFALEILQEMENVGQMTSSESTNQCMAQYVSRTINKAIASNVRKTMAGHQSVYLKASQKFISWISDRSFNVTKDEMREGAVSHSRVGDVAEAILVDDHLLTQPVVTTAE